MTQEESLKPIHSNTLMQRRLYWVDYAKGIGIFLVVVGHILRGLVNSSILQPTTLLNFVDSWIYAFHMPLFFFISGLFVQRSLSKPLNSFMLDKLYTIAYPYFIWSVLQGIFQAVGSRYTNKPSSLSDILKIGYEPIMQFWFLYTLFAIFLVYGIFNKLKLSPVLFLAFSILLYSLHVLDVSFGPWGVSYLFRRHAIYFALGAVIGSGVLTSFIARTKPYTLLLMTLTGYLVVGLAVQLQLAENLIAIPLLAIFGIGSSISLAVLLDKFNLVSSVKNWGIFSLEIFVAHTIAASILRIVIQKIFGVTEPVIHFILGTTIGIYAPIALSMICLKLEFPYMFTLKNLKKKSIVV
ncbi:acyltransferase [Nostocaceae cyanobacterium CENA357]|uniref:Acyltransferase n=1 Tax=Atlanticothrix silvestris CENA357 TaxID=1725252 RepID=A0A8J7HF59_9CYAN|nr:acyltransferase [Atlanticothrix silvestris]MBH8553904.1 acyltransferase [Atlanticothrix silvestris CENA357]